MDEWISAHVIPLLFLLWGSTLPLPPCLDITALAVSTPSCPLTPEPHVGPGRWCSLDVT